MRGRRGTTSGRCSGGSIRTKWSGGRCWPSRRRSSRTRSSRRRCTCWGRTRGRGLAKAGVNKAVQEVQGGGGRAGEGRGGAAHAVFQRLPAAVLLSDDG